MKAIIKIVLILSAVTVYNSCNTTEPPPPPNGEQPTLELKLEDVSCIEA